MPGSYSVTPLLSWLRAILDLKLYYRAVVIKTKQKQTNKQTNKNLHGIDTETDRWISGLELKNQKENHTFIDTWYLERSNIYIYIWWKKERIFNKWCCSNLQSVCWKIKINPYLSPCTKLSFKLNTIINIKYDTLNLIEDKLIDTEREMS